MPRAAVTTASPGAESPRCDHRISYGTLVGRGVTIGMLSQSMANFYGVGRVIVDKTGLSGGFDMGRGPVRSIVIERVERPSPD